MYVILDAVIISLSYVDAHDVAYLVIFSSETPIKHEVLY